MNIIDFINRKRAMHELGKADYQNCVNDIKDYLYRVYCVSQDCDSAKFRKILAEKANLMDDYLWKIRIIDKTCLLPAGMGISACAFGGDEAAPWVLALSVGMTISLNVVMRYAYKKYLKEKMLARELVEDKVNSSPKGSIDANILGKKMSNESAKICIDNAINEFYQL